MSCSRLLSVLTVGALLAPAAAAQSFVNFETPHVHPLDLTPDGTRLLAVNTPDDRLEVFDVSGAAVTLVGAIPVGLDPVSVRARTNGEVWVVNQISDSVSVVDLATMRVRATLDTDDEPCDVVFAGAPQRAFVSCSQASTVLVFDPANLAAAPSSVAIDAEDPRAMAVSLDGTKVYVAVFNSGNGSTVLGGGGMTGGNLSFPPNVVNDVAGPYGGVNPPPNSGASFVPPQNPGNPAPPKVSLIVKKDGGGQWMDDNGGNWTPLVSGPQAVKSGRPVGWDLPDHDVAVIDAGTLAVSWVNRLMNINMAVAVNPADGRITLVGTDATNQIRFEPVLEGRFLRVEVAFSNPTGSSTAVVDLNPHLDYLTGTEPQSERDKSLGDPRGIVWNAAGTKAYVTGMGSNNLVVIDGAGARAGLAPTIEVGQGPTGIALQASQSRLFVLDKFESAISVVSTASELETARVPFFDPSPSAVKVGRKHLYDTHKNSGLGQIACGSCHVDARFDRLAWDLGDPAGTMKSVAGQNLAANIPGLNGGFQDFHPMKGPMTTQDLRDIIGKEPHHWRGDRNGLEEFNGAFIGLQGDDANLTAQEMQQYEDFLATLYYPPNPFRNFDNTLPTNLPLPGHFTTGRFNPAGQPLPNGNAVTGLTRYQPPNLLDSGALACVTCHTMPTGVGTDYKANPPTFATLVPIPVGPNGEHHSMLVSQDGTTNVSMKVPQLRNLFEKVGFNATQLSNRAGFGYLHDGGVDSIERFVAEPVFNVTSDQDVANLVAFMLSFSGSDLPQGSTQTFNLQPPGAASKDVPASVGTQTTLVSLGSAPPAQVSLMSAMISLANANKVGLVAKGLSGGLARGWRYDGGGNWQSDRAAETKTTAQLQGLAAPGGEITFTVVPEGSETRIGIDRDLDGVLDRDELDGCSDPADAGSVPGDWTDLGSGLAGLHGVPAFSGCGTLAAGDPVKLALSGARENSFAHLFVGVSALNAPFKGGTLVPSPDVTILFLPTGPAGTLNLAGTMPGGLPSNFSLYLQFWINDPAGPAGFAASNALRGITP